MVSRIAPESSSNDSSGDAATSTTQNAAESPPGQPTSFDGGSNHSPPGSSNTRKGLDVAAKSAVGTRDSLLLGALVLGFAFAVGAVVIAAGVRGGRRTH